MKERDGKQTTATHKSKYELDGSFEISELVDDFDDYAVIRLVRPNGEVNYYYRNEINGIAFTQKGYEEAMAVYSGEKTLGQLGSELFSATCDSLFGDIKYLCENNLL